MGQRTWQVRSGADLGRAIADIRQARGLTQSELAVSAALSRDYLAHIEAGRSASLLEKLLRLLRRLGATVTITVDIVNDIEDDGSAQA
jgi:transcriptional regulator with XRE-family HTH domain